MAWNLCREDHDALSIHIDLPVADTHTLFTRTVDEDCCNPLKGWHDMGEPQSPTKEQAVFLRQAGQPLHQSRTFEGGAFDLSLGRNAVVHFTLSPVAMETEYGYDYEWYRIHS